jgi:tRNA-modifying protein YgfZ
MDCAMHPEWNSFLIAQGARIDGSLVSGFGHAKAELEACAQRPVLCDLSHESLILASGEEARAFLHGQFTNDVQNLADGQAQWNGYCSPKGRLLASFLMWPANQGFLLMLPTALAEAFRKRLSMFVLRSKVKLEDVSAQWVRTGLAGPGAAALLARHVESVPEKPLQSTHQTGLRILRLESERFVLVGSLDVQRALWQKLAADAVPAGVDAWTWHAIQAGVAEVQEATRESFVPQMVNFDLIGAVNFRKGCYPGQEIVARTQYRGILKRRMVRALLSAPDQMPAPGQSVYSPAFGDQAAGEIVLAAPAPTGGWELLLVAQIEALKTGQLFLGSLQGAALALAPLPYPVPMPE